MAEQGFEQSLTVENAFVFRITHIENLHWILRNGLRSASSDKTDPDFTPIGNPDLIDKRSTRAVPIARLGTLSDYIPFYFTPFSPMALNIKTGYGVPRLPNETMAVIVCRLRELMAQREDVVFTDSHAYLRTARFYADSERLDVIDWPLLRSRSFRRDEQDPGRASRYQAEALVFQSLPLNMISGIACYDRASRDRVRRMSQEADVDVKVLAKPGMYF